MDDGPGTPTLDYATPMPKPPRRPRQPNWSGVLAVSAIACGFVAWGIASMAVRGAFPGELGMATFLTALSAVLCAAALARAYRRRAAADPVPAALGVALAGVFIYLAIERLTRGPS